MKTKKKIWYFVAGIAIGSGVQLHYLFLFLVPISLLLVLYRNNKENLSRLLTYGAGIVVPLIPFIGFEIKNRFPNIRTIVAFLSEGKTVSYTGTPFNIIGDIIFRMFARLIFFFPGPEQYYRFTNSTLFWWKAGIVTAIILSLGYALFRIVRHKELKDILLFAWFISGTIFFMFYQKQIYDYYLVILFPLPFLLVGILFERWWKKVMFRPLVAIIFFLLLLLNYSGRPFLYAPNNQVDQVERAAKHVFELAEGKPFNFALITSSNSDHAYRYFLELWGNPPLIIENSENDPERKSVTDQLLVICEIGDCHPLGHSLWEIAGFGRAEIALQSKVKVLSVYKLVHLTD